jgi:hypothetical protein
MLEAACASERSCGSAGRGFAEERTWRQPQLLPAAARARLLEHVCCASEQACHVPIVNACISHDGLPAGPSRPGLHQACTQSDGSGCKQACVLCGTNYPVEQASLPLSHVPPTHPHTPAHYTHTPAHYAHTPATRRSTANSSFQRCRPASACAT